MEFKHCHIFSSQSEYEAFVNSADYVEPFLAITPDRDKSYTNFQEGKTLGAYNNHGSGLTVSAVDIGEKYMGQNVRRWTYLINNTSTATSIKNNYSSHGVYAPSIYIDVASTGTRQAVYWIYYRPHTSGLTAGGTASNIGGWTQTPIEDMGDGWFRVGQYRTKNTSTRTNDGIYTSIRWLYAVSGQSCTIDFVDAGYYVSGTTAIPETTRVDYSTDIEEEMLETPLSFDIVTGGVIKLMASSSGISRTLQYCKNDGPYSSVTITDTAPYTIDVVKGDTLRFKGDNSTYANSSGYIHFGKGNTTATFNIYGNIMSLITSTAFESRKTFASARVFQAMFQSMPGVLSCANLLLPSTALTNYCYYCMFDSCTNLKKAPKIIKAPSTASNGLRSMFYQCTSLEESPILDIDTIGSNGLYYAFYKCSKLKKITCLATDISGSGALTNWVNGVQTTSGTFIKKTGVEFPTGNAGIPTNWTVVEV